MVLTKKYRYRPIYKKLIVLKNNIQNKEKLLKFKKKKWSKLQLSLRSSSKYKKRNSFYKFYDQGSFNVLKFSNYFSKNYKNSLIQRRIFNIRFVNPGKKYIKKCLSRSVKNSNILKNKVNSLLLFLSFFNQRLDVTLLKSNFTLSIRSARQLISHGHVLVNRKVVRDGSFMLSLGDRVTFKKRSHRLVRYNILRSELWPLTTQDLCVSYSSFKITVIDSAVSSRGFSEYLNLNNIKLSYKT